LTRFSTRSRLHAATCALLSLALAASACTSPRGSATRAETEEQHLAAFQDLIGGSALTPDPDFEEGDYFAELAAEYADLPTNPVSQDPTFDDPLSTGPEPEHPLNPYLEFGERIVVYDDGRIMKPYPLPTGQGVKIHELLATYGDFSVWTPEVGMGQPLDTVVLDLKEKWVIEPWSDPRSSSLDEAIPIPLADVIFVTAVPNLLSDVEHFINLFAASAHQIEIEAKIVEITTTDSIDVGFSSIDNGVTPMFGLPDNTFLQSVDFSFANSVDVDALFTLSAVHDGLTFNAVLDAVADFENVSIISRPKVAVREGGRAEIVNTKQIPFFTIGGINPSGNFSAGLTYKEIGVQMYVIPRVIGTDTVILNIDIENSQETGTSVTFRTAGADGAEITNPIIAVRKARTIVRLEPGQAVILGGLISERTVEREKKVPLLGDIPLLGILFRSTYKRTEKTNVLFFIRPRILRGTDLNRPFE
jgi:type II secretory pathway component GspD/PulD (secretin)